MTRSEMLDAFFQDAHEALMGLENGIHAMRQDQEGQQDDTQMGHMLVLAHRLKGTSSLYGYPQLASLAGVEERLLESRPHLPTKDRQKLVELLSQMNDLMRQGLTQLDEGKGEKMLGLDFSASGASKQLQELVFSHPQAFKPQSVARQFHESQMQEHSAAPATAPEVAAQGLEQELREFYAANKETWEYYAPEVLEYLDTLRAQFGEAQPDTNLMFRAAHTIKGSSYMVGFTPLGDFAHKAEDLLGAIRDGQLAFDHDILQVLERAADTIELYLKVAEGDPTPLTGRAELLERQMQALAAGEALSNVQEQAALNTPLHGSAPEASVEKELREFYAANKETWEYYAPEVTEYLEALRGQFGEAQPDTNLMFRAAHTIKGSSYMVGFTPLGDFAHKAEDLLGAIRDGAQPLDHDVLQVLERAADTIELYLKVAEGDPTPLTGRAELLERQMQALAAGQSMAQVLETVSGPETVAAAPEVELLPPPAVTTVRVRSEQLNNLMEMVGELVVARSRVSQTLERLQGLEQAMADSQARFQRTVRDFEERYLNPDMVSLGQASETTNAATSTTSNTISQQFDELEFDTYSDLNILARSMTELSADFGEMRNRFGDGLREIADDNEDLGKLVRRLRQDVSRISRVPFTQALSRLRRWAGEHSEQFELKVIGEDLQIENSVLQNLNEPLLHLLTNAVYHGIGTPEEREAAGKPRKGNVSINAREVGNFLEVTVTDDGRGLNLDAIRIRALERGQRSAQEIAEMSDDEVARLILLPGLSTAREVTAGAGRGVGMDVVASSMRRLGGDLLIQTQKGVGTRITLRVPTSQQIIDVLQVRVGHQILGFATSVIQALREVSQRDLAQGDGGLEILDAGQWVSIIDLREIWGAKTPDESWKLVIVRTVSGSVAVRVDDFDRIEEVSVTPLSGVLSALDYLSATSVASTGDVLPILDPSGLQRLHTQPERWMKAGALSEQHTTQGSRVLLVDDSLSVRRVVSRMLERGGFEVQTANDGQEAFDLLQFGMPFDLVVTDLEMPRMNGYELLESVRGRQATHDLPMVVMTTRAGDKHQRLAFQLGANDYFSKPVDEALLIRRINKILSERQVP